jgi:hypothetical protein
VWRLWLAGPSCPHCRDEMGRPRLASHSLSNLAPSFRVAGLGTVVLVVGSVALFWAPEPPKVRRADAQSNATLKDGNLNRAMNRVYSRDDFKGLVVGSTPEDVKATIGPPSFTLEDGRWSTCHPARGMRHADPCRGRSAGELVACDCGPFTGPRSPLHGLQDLACPPLPWHPRLSSGGTRGSGLAPAICHGSSSFSSTTS